jgi:L-ascorbate metabolism protein UlaG (beta-lactamase superfamily)
MQRLLTALALLAALLAACLDAAVQAADPAPPATGAIEVRWLGQSTFRIVSPSGKVIVTDPWLRPNPITPAQYKDLAALGKVDLLLVTHGHGDHFADAPDIARLNNIPMYAPGDLNMSVGLLGILPPAQLPRMNKSGTVEPLPGMRLTAVHAEHSSVLVWKNPASGREEAHVGGEPVGFILQLENGFRIWHMGDTGLFGDMRLIAERYRPDLVLMPIGGNFTMDPDDAAWAARELIRPKVVIPMHYGANPLGKGTPAGFERAMAGSPIEVRVLKPGEATRF